MWAPLLWVTEMVSSVLQVMVLLVPLVALLVPVLPPKTYVLTAQEVR
jgi:hypothetical protein